MRHRWFILVAVLLLVMIGGAVAAFAYDSSRDDLIAEGVTIAGVDVGGMTSAEARILVRRELQRPLERPIAVRRGEQRFTLSAHDAGVKADVGGMVDEALSESRDGSIFSRVARDITGGEENAQVSARVTYSTEAVERLVERVESKLNRPARDAEVDFPSLEKVKEQKGRKVKAAALEQRIAQALTVPGVERTVRAPGADPQAQGHPAAARWQVPGGAGGGPIQLQAAPLQGPEPAEGVHGRGRRARVRHPGRALPHPEQGGGPRLARAEQRLGRRPRRHDRPGRHGREPAQGALARHLRRRRHPRHRPDLLARQRSLARLHPHGDSRT